MAAPSRQALYMRRKRQSGEEASITLSVPAEMKNSVDDAADAMGLTRKQWIIEAIQSKLDARPKGKTPSALTCVAILGLCVSLSANVLQSSIRTGTGHPNVVTASQDAGTRFNAAAVDSEGPRNISLVNEILLTSTVNEKTCRQNKVTRMFMKNIDNKPYAVSQIAVIGCGSKDAILSESMMQIPEDHLSASK